MHVEDIKAGLRKRGLSQAKIATQCGVLPSAVCHTLRGDRSRRIEAAIARAIGSTPEALWPERYKKIIKRAAA